MLMSQMKKYICCFMRANHAINIIYKLVSFLDYYLLYFSFKKMISDQDFMKGFNRNFISAMHGFRIIEVL